MYEAVESGEPLGCVLITSPSTNEDIVVGNLCKLSYHLLIYTEKVTMILNVNYLMIFLTSNYHACLLNFCNNLYYDVIIIFDQRITVLNIPVTPTLFSWTINDLYLSFTSIQTDHVVSQWSALFESDAAIWSFMRLIIASQIQLSLSVQIQTNTSGNSKNDNLSPYCDVLVTKYKLPTCPSEGIAYSGDGDNEGLSSVATTGSPLLNVGMAAGED